MPLGATLCATTFGKGGVGGQAEAEAVINTCTRRDIFPIYIAVHSQRQLRAAWWSTMHVRSKSCPVSITASALLFATLMVHHAVAGSHEGQAAETLTQAATDLPPAAHAPLADQAPELRAAIAGARISEPAPVARVLAELRIESAGLQATSAGWIRRSGRS